MIETVYFVRNPLTDAVKIGRAINVQKRISALQTGSGARLDLLRTVCGGANVEHWFHKTFKDRRVFGEWFTFHPDMMTAIPPLPLAPADYDPYASSPSDAFRREVKAFVDQAKMPITTFGIVFAGDPNFLANPAREYRWDPMQRIRVKMAEHGDAA